MCLGNIFQQFYNIADSIVAGQFLGVNALAAIGSTGDACGKITITDAIVHAQGADEAPAIGAESSVPEITIKKSKIHAYRGSNADYIGRVGDYKYQGGQIQGDITSSTVYKYLYDGLYDTSTPEGVVEFDENGEGKEQ